MIFIFTTTIGIYYKIDIFLKTSVQFQKHSVGFNKKSVSDLKKSFPLCLFSI